MNEEGCDQFPKLAEEGKHLEREQSNYRFVHDIAPPGDADCLSVRVWYCVLFTASPFVEPFPVDKEAQL